MERKEGHYNIDGKLYPSVTTILRVIAKPALTSWLQRQAAEKALLGDYDTAEKVLAAMALERDRSGDRGSDVHRIAQSWASGISVDLLPGPQAFVPAVQTFFRVVRPKVVATELTVYNTIHEYAGTLDLLADIGGQRYVVDYKTSKQVYREHGLQVEAYRMCNRVVDRNDIPLLASGTIADRGAVVLFKNNGTFTFNETNEDFGAFLSAKRLWEWSR